jgi:hypothetical protein
LVGRSARAERLRVAAGGGPRVDPDEVDQPVDALATPLRAVQVVPVGVAFDRDQRARSHGEGEWWRTPS